MAGVEQEQPRAAELESPKAACQAMQLAHSVPSKGRCPCLYRQPYAEVVHSRLPPKRRRLRSQKLQSGISWESSLTSRSATVVKSNSIVEFSSVMALAEIALAIRSEIDANKAFAENSTRGKAATLTVHASTDGNWFAHSPQPYVDCANGKRPYELGSSKGFSFDPGLHYSFSDKGELKYAQRV
jgi:hypothetical protein